MLRAALLVCCVAAAFSSDPAAPCVIELACAACLPDNPPLMRSRGADARGAVRAAPGEELLLQCRGGSFVAYPLRDALAVVCERGRYRVRHDGTLRHLLELGCQENVFEDVQHQLEDCEPPLQGRAYRLQEAHGAVHLATLCFDQDHGVAVHARTCNAPGNALPLAPHAEDAAPRSLLGNFNQMFDAATRHAAERLYSDDGRINRRLREILKHDRFSFAAQELTSAPLLGAQYFDEQMARVAEFVSNKVAAWRSVASGNLRHLQHDVAGLMRTARPSAALEVYAGTHDALALRTGHTKTKIFLQHERFPVPKYIWTVVYDRGSGKALAVAVLNDPYVSVSEVREAALCESACSRVSWLHELRRHRHYESPLYGLTYCCSVRGLAAAVSELPAGLLANVTDGDAGMLADLPAATGV